MDHAAAERLDLLQRPRQIVYGEVGQGEGVARPATPRMEPDRRGSPSVFASPLRRVWARADLRAERPRSVEPARGHPPGTRSTTAARRAPVASSSQLEAGQGLVQAPERMEVVTEA